MDIVYEIISKRIIKRKTKKTQVVLGDTFRNVTNFLLKLKLRGERPNTIIPHFIIKKDGGVIKLIDDDNYFKKDDNPVHKKRIYIFFENLGYLTRDGLNNRHINWVGDVHKGSVYNKTWKGRTLWDPYTSEQMESYRVLISEISDKHDIPKQYYKEKSKIKVDNYHGIIKKSFLDDIYLDINPSFNEDK